MILISVVHKINIYDLGLLHESKSVCNLLHFNLTNGHMKMLTIMILIWLCVYVCVCVFVHG